MTNKVLRDCDNEVKDIRDHGLRGADDEQNISIQSRKSGCAHTGDLGLGAYKGRL